VVDHGIVLWCGGLLVGGSLVLWLHVLDSVPVNVDRWRAGAAEERRTERALRPLQRVGWTITHDLDLPLAGNIDHLAVGPAGVFVLDSKAWGGVVSVDQDGATITPRDDPDAAWVARGQHRGAARTAAPVSRVMAAAARVAGPAARSVVVVWGTFPQRVAASGGIAYVAGEHLHDWLLAQRHCLNRAELAALSAANVPSLFSSESRLGQPDVGERRQPAGL
jgi:Nuclease-related domain